MAVLFLALCYEHVLLTVVLNDFIRHFEPVDYDYESLMWQHHRLRRSVAGPRHVELHFTAFGRSVEKIKNHGILGH